MTGSRKETLLILVTILLLVAQMTMAFEQDTEASPNTVGAVPHSSLKVLQISPKEPKIREGDKAPTIFTIEKEGPLDFEKVLAELSVGNFNVADHLSLPVAKKMAGLGLTKENCKLIESQLVGAEVKPQAHTFVCDLDAEKLSQVQMAVLTELWQRTQRAYRAVTGGHIRIHPPKGSKHDGLMEEPPPPPQIEIDLKGIPAPKGIR